jgi:hypothetical protein
MYLCHTAADCHRGVDQLAVCTLLLHYCYTVITLLSHYCYTVVTLYVPVSHGR